jgi:hypothetical protein
MALEADPILSPTEQNRQTLSLCREGSILSISYSDGSGFIATYIRHDHVALGVGENKARFVMLADIKSVKVITLEEVVNILNSLRKLI